MLNGQFIHESGTGWIGITYVYDSIGRTIFIRPDTDHGVIDCQNMMDRINRMTEAEKLALIDR